LSTSPVICSHFTLGNPQKSFFNIIIHILQIICVSSDTVVAQKKMSSDCCSAGLAVYLLLFSASYIPVSFRAHVKIASRVRVLTARTERVLAPGYKGRARFKFFAERCPHRNDNLHDFEQQLSPILVGQLTEHFSLVICSPSRKTKQDLERGCPRGLSSS